MVAALLILPAEIWIKKLHNKYRLQLSNKILHIVYQSVPNVSGSSSRTENILLAQRKAGLEPIVVSSPSQQPVEIDKAISYEVINSTKYYRSFLFNNLKVGEKSSFLIKLKKILAFPFFIYKVYVVCKKEKPDILHAHSMFYCAIPAIIVGRFLKLPTVYEVRSTWYLNPSASKNPLIKAISVISEKLSVKYSNAAIAISDGIKQEFSSIRDDIYVIRNAVHANDLQKKNYEVKCIEKFGYVGSVIELEGLCYIIQSFAILKKKRPNIEFHIFGSGSALKELKEYAKKIGSPAFFHGQVSFDQISSCYTDIDCIINYRNDNEISELVTPLKPLEAIAFNKPLICSNVRGYVEIIGGLENAFFVTPRSSKDLCKMIEFMCDTINHSEIENRMGKAKLFISQNRTWEKNILLQEKIYSDLVKNFRK